MESNSASIEILNSIMEAFDDCIWNYPEYEINDILKLILKKVIDLQSTNEKLDMDLTHYIQQI